MLKQVDDLLVQAPSMEELEKNLNETLEDGRKNGAMFSIKKFRAGKKVIFSGMELDASGSEVKIGPTHPG